MKNNERNSRKRLNSLILLVAFTAVMLIVSTYAWFSTQKNVSLMGLEGVVNVAEGLQISLDASTWVNSINFSDFDQTNPTAWKVKSTSATQYLADNTRTFQSPADGITNIVPTELLPVSTTGYNFGENTGGATGDGIGESALKFYRGTNQNTKELMNDTKLLTEDVSAGYFAFDLFVMNTSAGNADDVLQLDSVSDVRGKEEAAGVQNTARVALALYNNAGSTEMSAKDIKAGSTIIAGTSTGKTIKDIAIWEPNANAHTDTIKNSLANSLKLDATEPAYTTLTNITKDKAANDNTQIYSYSKFDNDDKLPTYALTKDSLPATTGDGKTVHIADVYDWRLTDSASTAAKGVKKQFTLQTDAYADGSNLVSRGGSVDFVSTGKLEVDEDATDTTFTIGANQYHKIRVYFWMEGQDPDCINAASLGKGLVLDLGFSKPGQDNSGAQSGS